MVNLIGDAPPSERLLAVDGAHLHLYGKAPRAGRKIGHVTVVQPSQAARDERRAQVEGIVASATGE